MAKLAILIILCVAVATQARVFDPRIVNGEDALPGEIPYQISLQTLSNFHFCGGSMLNKHFVITAAHCVTGKTPKSIKVVAGSVNLDSPQSTHMVDKIMVHESYNAGDSWRNDIALVHVTDPFEESSLMSFVPLPEEHQEVDDFADAVVSGWGNLRLGGPSTKKLQRVVIQISPQSYCRDQYKGMGYNVHDTHICANDREIEKGSCHGDSGGPLTVDGKLVGLVSWAMGCAHTVYPTVYTRVAEYLDWIKANAV